MGAKQKISRQTVENITQIVIVFGLSRKIEDMELSHGSETNMMSAHHRIIQEKMPHKGGNNDNTDNQLNSAAGPNG